MRIRCVLLFLCASIPLLAQSGPASEWTIDKVSIVPSSNERTGRLDASLHDQLGRTKKISASTISDHILSAFTVDDRLVLFGDAGRAQSVEIFTISKGTTLDWFICFDPWRISPKVIASTEFYHTLAAGTPVDVVLAYNLAATPRENRLLQVSHLPPTLSDQPTQVGVPIYPSENSRLGSYDNRQADAHASSAVIGSTYKVIDARWLSFQSIQFVEEKRQGMAIVVIDLGGGLLHARSGSTLVEALSTSNINVVSVQEKSPGKLQLEVEIDGVQQTKTLIIP